MNVSILFYRQPFETPEVRNVFESWGDAIDAAELEEGEKMEWLTGKDRDGNQVLSGYSKKRQHYFYEIQEFGVIERAPVGAGK